MTKFKNSWISGSCPLSKYGFVATFLMIVTLNANGQQIDAAVVVARQPNFVNILQQQCQQVPVQVSQQNTGGTIVGGVLGAALGNQVGSQLGGSQAANAGTVEYRTQCTNVPVQVQQGETVTFEYRGRRFSQAFP